MASHSPCARTGEERRAHVAIGFSEGVPVKYDAAFRGPIANRSCTDIVCCVLFMVVIAAYIVVGFLAWLNGDPRKVIYPTDSQGNYCGRGNYSDKPFLLYFDIFKCAGSAALLNFNCPTTQICVKQCPRDFWVVNMIQPPSQAFNAEYCRPGFNLATTSKTVQQILQAEDCAGFTVPSKDLVNRCVPVLLSDSTGGNVTVNGSGSVQTPSGTASAEAVQEASNYLAGVLNARDLGMKIFSDFTKSWYWIIICLVIAMVVSLLFLLLLRFTAGFLIWAIIIGLVGVVGYGIYHCYREYDNLKGKPGADLKLTDVGLQTDLSVYLQYRDTWLAFMIILAVVETLILLILIFLRKRLLIAIALVREASRAISYMMSSLFYPLVTFVLLFVCVAYWGITALYLSTSGRPIHKVFVDQAGASAECRNISNADCHPSNFSSASCPQARCSFLHYGGDSVYEKNLPWLQVFNVFAFLWLMNFVIALGQCTLAGAFASYYWAFHKPRDLPALPVAASFMRAFRYHTGSLAFGALIIAIIQLIRIILEYMDHKLRGAENRVLKFLLCCLKCCFWCLEKFMKFINRNAYIMIAIYGKNFCVSAKNALSLLMRNIVRVVVLDKVTDFLLLLGKLVVVGGVGVFAFFFFSNRIMIPDTPLVLNYYWVPIVTVVVGSYMIAHGFFSVYGMCVDTLFLCFLEDLERNDGSEEKPYFMPKSLLKILNKKNKAPKGAE
ncbi:choline transporter-like protein 4 isoform X1 [Petromyzon marinus]|uniref:Choline transporter-like protein n=2 Tax=Petromyzon marinus TaxID=7757 RepID=A0AAJ7U6K3_PETMA|nr:choline transporter-like protein 4 isoform X1 [Petromyzon marinus]